LSTKIHVTTDALGNLLSFHLSPGQACDYDKDLDKSRHLIENFFAKLKQSNLPAHHRDPFDRLLVARSQVEKMTLEGV
jgi:hypothetical protein